MDATDNPHVIFETLNARGTSLEQSDLIKNYVFDAAGIEHLDQEEKYWNFGEWWLAPSGESKSNNRIDVFLWHWIKMSRQTEDITAGQVYDNFREYREKDQAQKEIGVITANLREAGEVFRKLEEIPDRPTLQKRDERQPDEDAEKDARYRRMIAMSNKDTIMPVLIRLGLPDIPKEEQEKSLQALDNYLTRRAICSKTTTAPWFQKYLLATVLGSVNATAAGKGGGYTIGENVEHALLSNDHRKHSEGGSAWPGDTELRDNFTRQPLYRWIGAPRVATILEAVERHLRNSAPRASEQAKAVLPGPLTIEHILPKSWERSWTDLLEKPSSVALRSETEMEMDEFEQLLEDMANKAIDFKEDTPEYLLMEWEVPVPLRPRVLHLMREVQRHESRKSTVIREIIRGEKHRRVGEQEEHRARRIDIVNSSIDRIGNLTLVTRELNQELSNNPWKEKKQTLREHSTLLLNKELLDRWGGDTTWDEVSIEARASRLCNIVVLIWREPFGPRN